MNPPESLILVTDEHTPSDVILMAAAEEAPISDLFPPNTQRYQDVLTGYQGQVAEASPFKDVLNDIRNRRTDIYREEEANDWLRTNETRRGLAATLLQGYLAETIGRDYDELLHTDLTPREAISKIGAYVLEQEEKVKDTYTDVLELLTHDLAARDRQDEAPEPTEIDGIPVLPMNEILLALGEIPLSEEAAREERKDFLASRIHMFRNRLQRLAFERLSSFAILRLATD